MSVYANGELLGTYGSNLGDPDFNIFNGLSGGLCRGVRRTCT